MQELQRELLGLRTAQAPAGGVLLRRSPVDVALPRRLAHHAGLLSPAA